MKSKRSLVYTALASLAMLAVSCTSLSERSFDRQPRFYETAAADVVLRFYSWNYIFLAKPEYRESGYLREIRRDTIGQAFGKLGVRHNLAVVVLGRNYDSASLSRLVNEWKSILAAQGFHRIVCVRASDNDEINGSQIIDDSQLPIAQASQSAHL